MCEAERQSSRPRSKAGGSTALTYSRKPLAFLTHSLPDMGHATQRTPPHRHHSLPGEPQKNSRAHWEGYSPENRPLAQQYTKSKAPLNAIPSPELAQGLIAKHPLSAGPHLCDRIFFFVTFSNQNRNNF